MLGSLFINFCDVPWWLFWLIPFLLGVLLGWLIWSKYKKWVRDLENNKVKLQTAITGHLEEINDFRSKQSELVGQIALLKGRLREVEASGGSDEIIERRIELLNTELKEERSRKADLQGEIALLHGTISELKAEASKKGAQGLSASSGIAGGEDAKEAQEQIRKIEEDLKYAQTKRAELEGDIAIMQGHIAELEYKKSRPDGSDKSAPTKKKTSPNTGKSEDNLKLIEGIGPKIEQILKSNGIKSFRTLAGEQVTHLEEILKNAGPRYRLANPGTWPKQAELAAEGKFEELEAYQNLLKGGT